MGAKLVTYYRKQDAADTGHLELKKGAPGLGLGVAAGGAGFAKFAEQTSWCKDMQ